MIKRLLFYALFICLSCNQMILAQKSLSIVNSSDNTVRRIDLNSIDKITFTNTDVLIQQNNGNKDSYSFTTVGKLYFETTTGVSNPLAVNSQNIFPNPANEFISIKNIQPGTQVKIYNLSGIMVANIIYPASGHININNLQKGLYIVKTEIQTLKFMKL